MIASVPSVSQWADSDDDEGPWDFPRAFSYVFRCPIAYAGSARMYVPNVRGNTATVRRKAASQSQSQKQKKTRIARYRAKQQTQRGIGVPEKAKSGGFRLSGRSGGSGVGLRLGVLGQAQVDRRGAVLPRFLPRVIVGILLLVDVQTDDSASKAPKSSAKNFQPLEDLFSMTAPFKVSKDG